MDTYIMVLVVALCQWLRGRTASLDVRGGFCFRICSEGQTMQRTSVPGMLTVGEAADRLGVQSWKIGRLFRRGLLPEPERMGCYRVLLESDLPKIEHALREAGYLTT